MTQINIERVFCTHCYFHTEVRLYNTVNVTLDPELKDVVFSDQLNRFQCPACHQDFQPWTNLLYHDMRLNFAVWYMPLLTKPEYAELLQYWEQNASGSYLDHAPITRDWEDFKQAILTLEQGLTSVKPPAFPPELEEVEPEEDTPTQ